MVKNLLVMWETWVLFLGWEHLLEESMATHSNILAWRISWTEEPGGLQFMALQNGPDMTSVTEHARTYTHMHVYTHIYTHRHRHTYLVPLALWFDCCRLYSKLSVP